MDIPLPRFAFENNDLAVAAESQLATLAQLNPAACVVYADMLIKELSAAMARCTVGDATTAVGDVFEQIHTLKNGIIPTGCQPLLDAYASLQAGAGRSGDRQDLHDAYNDIAEATQRLIAAFMADR